MKISNILPIVAMGCVGAASAAQSRPNVVLILADDMGYSDLGCMGSEIETPNLDALANKGVLFNNFYNTSRSCPSRASLLTGQYQWDAGMGHMNDTNSSLDEYQGFLNHESVTIAEMMQSAGYRTFMSGKWHVGDAREDWPDKRGFDQFYGTPVGGGVYFYPSKFYKRTLYHNGEEVFPKSDWYSTDGFTDAAVDFIAQPENKEQPFFMYMAYIAPHFPLQAKEEDIAKYEGKYNEGYNAIRDGRIAKQRQLGMIEDGQPIPELDPAIWNGVKDKASEARKMAVYAAMVDCLDQNVGKLVEELKRQGLYDNTVIMFLSDNGGCSANFNHTPGAVIGSADSNVSYGNWYKVSNTPMRYGKAKEHEGGIKTPLIMHWPEGLNKRHSGRVDEIAHITDIMPTCIELAKGRYPKEFKGNVLSPLDGQSLLRVAKGKKQDPKRYIFWEHEGNQAVRRGDWKLVRLYNKSWELYDLSVDPYETNDLAKSKSEMVSELTAAYKQWADEHGVLEWPEPKRHKRE